jgi:preprotein translocase subunit SecF
VLEKIYGTKNYKYLFLVPAVMLVFALFGVQYITLGVDLKGGYGITIYKPMDIHSLKKTLENDLEGLDVREINTEQGKGVIIEFTDFKDTAKAKELYQSGNIEAAKNILSRYTEVTDDFNSTLYRAREVLKNALLEKLGVVNEKVIIKEVGPSLGSSFLQHSINVIAIALALMSIIVFLSFRNLVPSVAIIQAAVFDVVFALGMMGYLGIPLSLPTVAALLMLIGYSVDTDILLTTRMLKRTGPYQEKIIGAFRTGIYLTICALVSAIVMYAVAGAVGIEVLGMIGSVLTFGLFADIISTWFTNAGMLVWYMRRRRHG